MSLVFDGRVSNQSPNFKLDGGVTCSKCCKEIEAPNITHIAVPDDIDEHIFSVYNYLRTSHYIYESKSGKAVVYCSKYCRDKHNHRFTKRIEIKEVIRYIFKPDDNRTIEEIVNTKDKK